MIWRWWVRACAKRQFEIGQCNESGSRKQTRHGGVKSQYSCVGSVRTLYEMKPDRRLSPHPALGGRHLVGGPHCLTACGGWCLAAVQIRSEVGAKSRNVP